MKHALALCLLVLPVAAQADSSALAKAERLFDRARWAQAAEAYEAITQADPEQGEAWYRLAYSRHSLGQFSEAAAANERACEFPRYRATSFYNLACARSLLGEIEEASAALDEAVAAGFLDFDLMQSDADLEALRQARTFELPEPRSYEEARGGNGVVVPYAIQLPRDYDPEREYPALVAFSPGGGGPLSTSWALEHLWTEGLEGWIVVHPVAPDRGWINHPAHHALNDLMKKVKKRHAIEDGKFHVFGFLGGCRPATTFSQMSRSYFKSLTVVSSLSWDGWDDGDLRDFKKMPVHMFVGEQDTAALTHARRVEAVLKRLDGTATLTVLQYEDALVPSLRGRELAAAIGERLR